MAKSDEVLDRVFREKLENHLEAPSPAAWDKLDTQLNPSEQPKKNFWWAIAAAMPLLLGLGYLIWSQAPQAEQESSLATTEEVLEIPPVLESTPEAETAASQVDQKKVSLAETNITSARKPAQKSKNLPQKNFQKVDLEPMVAEAITSPSLQAAEEATGNPTTESKIWVSPEPTRIAPTPNTSQTTLADAEEIEGYRIRIFSDGLKKEEAPNKNLLTELGKTVGQVEELLGKLDEGIEGLQEKKERLFSSLISRKAASTEKQ